MNGNIEVVVHQHPHRRPGQSPRPRIDSIGKCRTVESSPFLGKSTCLWSFNVNNKYAPIIKQQNVLQLNLSNNLDLIII